MPRAGKIADGLRQEFARLVKKHGETDLLPLYLENGVYNFYLKEDTEKAKEWIRAARPQRGWASTPYLLQLPAKCQHCRLEAEGQ